MESKMKEARKAAGLTQEEMSKLFGIPKRTIESWEMGERKPAKYLEMLIIEKLGGMRNKGRLIDADDLIDEVKAWRISFTGELTQMEIIKECKEAFLNMIEEQPTIE